MHVRETEFSLECGRVRPIFLKAFNLRVAEEAKHSSLANLPRLDLILSLRQTWRAPENFGLYKSLVRSTPAVAPTNEHCFDCFDSRCGASGTMRAGVTRFSVGPCSLA